MFALLLLLLPSLCQSLPHSQELKNCDSSGPRVSALSLNSALSTFLCYTEKELATMEEDQKKRKLALKIAPSICHSESGSFEKLVEALAGMTEADLVKMVNVVINNESNEGNEGERKTLPEYIQVIEQLIGETGVESELAKNLHLVSLLKSDLEDQGRGGRGAFGNQILRLLGLPALFPDGNDDQSTSTTPKPTTVALGSTAASMTTASSTGGSTAVTTTAPSSTGGSTAASTGGSTSVTTTATSSTGGSTAASTGGSTAVTTTASSTTGGSTASSTTGGSTAASTTVGSTATSTTASKAASTTGASTAASTTGASTAASTTGASTASSTAAASTTAVSTAASTTASSTTGASTAVSTTGATTATSTTVASTTGVTTASTTVASTAASTTGASTASTTAASTTGASTAASTTVSTTVASTTVASTVATTTAAPQTCPGNSDEVSAVDCICGVNAANICTGGTQGCEKAVSICRDVCTTLDVPITGNDPCFCKLQGSPAANLCAAQQTCSSTTGLCSGP